MTREIMPGQRTGEIRIPASKSVSHRMLILAALGDKDVTLKLNGVSSDIQATSECLAALGAGISETEGKIEVSPIKEAPSGARVLRCRDSGATLRFLMPVAGALGAETVFIREGRLPKRPLEPFGKELVSHGMSIREEGEKLICSGRLKSGRFTLPGNISSQFISALLLALPLLSGDSSLEITGKSESEPYIKITEESLKKAGIRFETEGNIYLIPGNQRYALPEKAEIEGDWSSAAFFLCLGALSEKGIGVRGLNIYSFQGDRAVLGILESFGAKVSAEKDLVKVSRGTLKGQRIDASSIPDLMPVLSVLAAVSEGATEIYNAGRLRLKESDRLRSSAELISSLGGEIEERSEGLFIRGVERLRGGEADPFMDHRLCMSAAVAASACEGSVRINGAECVSKSYPRFFEDLEALEIIGGER